jgi:hypothetical protein
MYLSNFQKEIVRKIANDKIKTIKDFLKEFNLIERAQEKKEKHIGDEKITEGNSDFSFDNDHFRVKDRDTTFTKLIDFKKVVNLLSRADLIEIEKSANLGMGYSEVDDRPKEIINFIWSFQDLLIIAYNEIKNFEKDFLTPQERNQKWQRWIPIIVAVLTVLLSTIINYFIYTKEREVTIKNQNAFKDSIYVKILNVDDSTKQFRIVDSIRNKSLPNIKKQ